MAQQTINVGAAPNDGTGTPLRTAFQYTNSNFTELYTAVGPSGNNIVVPGTATITGDLTVATSALKVTGGKVGIGTASPAYELDVSSATVSNQLRIFGSTQNSITFGNAAGGASNGFLMGRSYSSDDANNLFVYDIANSALRFFIGNTGNVGIATASPLTKLHVVDGDVRIDQTGSGLFGINLVRSAGTTVDWYNYIPSGSSDVRWYAGGDKMTLDTSGNLSPVGNVVMATSGKGIDFSATASGSGTMTSELLNDYEEGTFTPAVAGSTDAGSASYTRSGYYTKVGRLVTITVYMNWTAHTGTGNMRFTGLPFTSANVATNYNGISIGYVNNIALTAGNVLYGLLEFGTTYITATQSPTGGGAYSLVPIDTAGEIAFTATYFV